MGRRPSCGHGAKSKDLTKLKGAGGEVTTWFDRAESRTTLGVGPLGPSFCRGLVPPSSTVRGTLQGARVDAGGLAALAADVADSVCWCARLNEGVNIAALAADIAD